LSAISRKSRAFWMASAERLEQRDRRGREFARRPAADDQPAHDPVLADQRHRQQGAESGTHEKLADPLVGGALGEEIRHLHRLTQRSRAPQCAFAQARRRRAQARGQLVAHRVRHAQVKFLGRFVVLVDRAGIARAQCHRVRHDAGQHGPELERRAHRLADLRERRQLVDRAGQLAEETRVLDGQRRLVRERPEQPDVLVVEPSRGGARDADGADAAALAEHRHEQQAAVAAGLRDAARARRKIGRLRVGDVDGLAIDDDPRQQVLVPVQPQVRLLQDAACLLGEVARSHEVDLIAVHAAHRREHPIAEPERAVGDDLENRLHVGRRPVDDAQDPGDRRLLRQGGRSGWRRDARSRWRSRPGPRTSRACRSAAS